MASLEAENTQSLFESCVNQLDKGQDFVYHGKTTSGQKFMVVCDGHGWGEVIKCLREIDWVDLISKTNTPIENVNTIISSLGVTQGDGATITIMHQIPEGIRISWLGDSTCRVYAGGREVWRSDDHNSQNQAEVERMRLANYPSECAWDLSVVNSSTMTMKQSNYYHLGTYRRNDVITSEKINMTRALGHNNKCSDLIQTHTIYYSDYLSHIFGKDIKFPILWRVVIGSDGLWDMICEEDNPIMASSYTDAYDLLNLASTRWEQKWVYECPIKKIKLQDKTIPRGDDIGVAVFQELI
jgi:serine/threonine protein phosphatase PrpC